MQVALHALPAAFPPSIVERFAGKVLAITGFETQVTRIDDDGREHAVPCSDAYNHHWNLFLASSKAPFLDEEYESLSSEGGCALSRARAPRAVGTAAAPGAAPIRQVLSEANGNEHRGTFHGTPVGYAQLLDSPATLALVHMTINTRNPAGHRLDPRAAPQPRNSVTRMAGAGGGWSGILECPCTTRRNISLEDHTIDGRKYGESMCLGSTAEWRSPLEASRNTICPFAQYVQRGGLACCADMNVLLDADQPDYAPTTYYHKLRIYYEDHADGMIRASPTANAFRLHYEIEFGPNEYNIPQCAAGTPPARCVHELSATFHARDLFGGLSFPTDARRLNCTYYEDVWCGQIADVEAAGGRFVLLNMAFHQHSPALLEGLLLNERTGDVICRATPVHGTVVGEPLNELGYGVAIPPCVWGSAEEGLPPPPVLDLATPLKMIGRYNSSLPHYGVMSQWQGRGGLLK